VLPAYQKRAEAMAKHFGVPYIHVQNGIHLVDADFADLYHLLDSGRAKWQAELAKLVAPITREATAAPAAGAPAAAPSPAAT
jgi:nitrogenase molybdenum-iron protein alpha/beta subunit